VPFDHNRHQEAECRQLAKELGFDVYFDKLRQYALQCGIKLGIFPVGSNISFVLLSNSSSYISVVFVKKINNTGVVIVPNLYFFEVSILKLPISPNLSKYFFLSDPLKLLFNAVMVLVGS
jgi:hypothetical protein